MSVLCALHLMGVSIGDRSAGRSDGDTGRVAVPQAGNERGRSVDEEDVFARLNAQAGVVLFRARLAVSTYGGDALEPEHLLLGIVQASPETFHRYASEEWPIQRVERELVDGLTSGNQVPKLAEVPGSGRTNDALARAAAASGLGEESLTVDHLLLGLVEDKGRAGRLLQEAGISREKILALRRNSTK